MIFKFLEIKESDFEFFFKVTKIIFNFLKS